MDIREFFKLFEGQWVSQRTLHHIQTEKTDAAKADLWIESVECDAPKVLEACEKVGLSPENVFNPVEITYKATLANGRSQIGTTLMVPIESTPTSGKIISMPTTGSAVLGSFVLGDDAVMTLTNQVGDSEVVERIWYASENLRVRSVTQSTDHGPSEATFCSEIRRVGSMQPKPTDEQSQQSLSPLAAWRARQGQTG